MKKILAGILTLFITLSLGACAQPEEEKKEENNKNTEQKEENKDKETSYQNFEKMYGIKL